MCDCLYVCLKKLAKPRALTIPDPDLMFNDLFLTMKMEEV